VHLNATEHNHNIVFLHKVQEGPASKSYGLQVAKLAGIPTSVLIQAQEQLRLLEEGTHSEQPPKTTQPNWVNAAETQPNNTSLSPQQSGLFDALPNPAMEALKKINPDNLSPREALEQLYRLKELYIKGK